MFEIINSVLSILNEVRKSFNFDEWRKMKNMRNLGRSLYMLFIELNQILLSGRYLLQRIHDFTSWDTEVMIHHPGIKLDLKFIAMEQSFNINRLTNTVYKFSRELQIVDYDAYNKIINFVYGKKAILDTLSLMLFNQQLPLLRPNYNDIEVFLNLGKENIFNNNEFYNWLTEHKSVISGIIGIKKEKKWPSEEAGLNKQFLKEKWEYLTARQRDAFYHYYRMFIYERSSAEAVDLNSVWDKSTIEKFKAFILDNNPDKQLDELEELLKQLNNTLKNNFKLEEIVLDVCDKRFEGHFRG